MWRTQTSSLLLALLLCTLLVIHNSVELKPKIVRPLKVPTTVLIPEIDTILQQDSEIMSIVDTFVGNRGKGSNTGGLLYRRGQVFYTAARVFVDYKIVQWRCNQMTDVDEKVITDIWNEAHERNAKFLGNKFISLEGLWVKLGQYLSSRADVMPDAYLRVLSKCQVQYRIEVSHRALALYSFAFLWNFFFLPTLDKNLQHLHVASSTSSTT